MRDAPPDQADALSGRALVAAAALALGLALPSSAAASIQIFLPAPTAQLSAQPPLRALAQTLETRFRGRIGSRLRVTVDVDRSGRPVAVRAEQRLTISALGDYFFVVPAPLVSVAAAPGSAAPPGQRAQGIVWQSFSPGRRTLAALVSLRRAAAAPVLPLRVQIVRGGIRIANATAVSVLAYDAALSRAEVVPVIHELRRAVGRNELPRPGSVVVPETPPTTRIRAEAVFAVHGTLRFGRQRVRFAGRIGPGAKRVLTVLTGKRERPKVDLVATPELPRELLRAAPGRLDGRRLLALAYRTYLAIARGEQYTHFLASPDPTGPSSAAFVYRTAPAPAAAVRTFRSGDDAGLSTLVVVILAVLGVAALSGLVVLWAHL